MMRIPGSDKLIRAVEESQIASGSGKRLRFMIVASLALNASLLARLVLSGPSAPSPSPASRASFERSAAQNAGELPSDTGAAPLSVAGSPDFVTVDQPFTWSRIESADYRVYVGNLRAVGCPEQTVRDIIIPEVTELFYRRVKDLVDTVQNRFWELIADKNSFEKMIQEKQHELENLNEERAAILKELLGANADHRSQQNELAELEQQENRRHFLDFLPADKIEQCLATDRKFNALREQLTGANPPLESKDLQTRLNALKEQQDNEFEGLLSPAEMAEYKLRNSSFASIRFRTNGFDATEEELKEIVRIQQKFSKSSSPQNGSVSGAQTADAQKQQRQAIQDLIGGERFAHYERAQDNRYQQFYCVTDRLQLPPEVADEAYSIRASAESFANKIRSDRSVDDEQRNAQLTAVRSETERSLVETLGRAAFEIYQSRSGQWLSQLDASK